MTTTKSVAMILLPMSVLLGLGGPEDLTQGFEVPAGVRVELWAESPQLFNPAAIDVDEHGRVWVAEAVNYRKWGGRNEGREHPAGDRIVVLEDTDGDGVCDSSTVFAQDEDLVSPLGIAVIDDAVYVSCSPNLFVYRDLDGDGKSDERETLLTGFGGFNHDHGLHSVVPGPDGYLYMAVGNAGPHIVTDKSGFTLRSGSIYSGGGPKAADNKPGLVSDDGQVWTGGLILRVRPDGTGLEVMAHNFRNNYEVALDSFGNMYQSDNDDDGNRGCRTLWCMPYANHGYFSEDGTRYWSADRRPGQDTRTAHWHQDDPGVVPAGCINGAGGPTGVCVYEGELLAKWFYGCVLNADAGARVVYAHKPVRKGAGIELEPGVFLRPKPEREDRDARWFRPSDVAVAPDGSVFVADWFDPGVGGHAAGDREAYGRILRVVPEGVDIDWTRPDLDTEEGLWQGLASPNLSLREHARKLLARRQNRAMSKSAEATERPEQNARRMLLRGAARGSFQDEQVYRLEQALSLRDRSLEEALGSFLDLAGRYDGEDRYFLEALGIGARGKEEGLYAELAAEYGDSPRNWDARFEGLAWRLHSEGSRDAFVARAMDLALPESARRRAIDALAFMSSRAAAEAVLTIAQAGPTDLRDYAAWWIENRDGNDWHAFELGARLGRGALDEAELVWKSDVLRSGLVDIDIDVTDAETLWLVVTDGGDGNGCDWAAWVEPRFEGPNGKARLIDASWTEAESGWGEVQVGRNCVGGELAVGQRIISDSIGTHAYSHIGYRVPPGATRFVASAGPERGGTSQNGGRTTSVAFEVRLTRPERESPVGEWTKVVADAQQPRDARIIAALMLASDPRGALQLIRLADEGKLDDGLRERLTPAIHRNPDLGVRALANHAFPREVAGKRVPTLDEILALDGDAERGSVVWLDVERSQCMTCHAYQLGDTSLGGDIGPELSRIGEKLDDAALLDSILNPSAGIVLGYDTWLFETEDGGLYSGFLLADGETIVLKDTQGYRTVLERDEVIGRAKQLVSTMPDGVALDLEPQELRDLVAFLRAPRDAAPSFEEPVVLFDGTSLDAWTYHLTDPAAKMGDVFSVADGVLSCEGNPIGYLRTKAKFESFRLTLDWRFDKERGAGNSGVLLRQIGPDEVWPRSIEAQLHHRDAGDIWNIGEFPMKTDERRTRGRRTTRLQPSSEKPLGEWNHYDILFDGPRLELRVNGVLQNTADWCRVEPGYICLQSEGAPIQFRNITIMEKSK